MGSESFGMEELVKLFLRVAIFIALVLVLFSFYEILTSEGNDDQKIVDFFRVAVEVGNLSESEELSVPISSDQLLIKTYYTFTNDQKGGIPPQCLNQVQTGSCMCLYNTEDDAKNNINARKCVAFSDRHIKTNKEVFVSVGATVPVTTKKGISDKIYVELESNK